MSRSAGAVFILGMILAAGNHLGVWVWLWNIKEYIIIGLVLIIMLLFIHQRFAI